MSPGRGRAMILQRSTSEPVTPGSQLSENVNSQLLRRRPKIRPVSTPLGSPRIPKKFLVENKPTPSTGLRKL